MLFVTFAALFAVIIASDASPTPNSKDGAPIGELPDNWDQTKDDTQSLFLNKSDKNDLEPYPLALSEEGNGEGYEQAIEQRFDSPQVPGELDNLIMRPEFFGEPPAMEGLAAGFESTRRKRGSGTKVGGAGAATKVATNNKNGSGKKNLKSDKEMNADMESLSQEPDVHRRKRGSGTKVGGAAASAKTATKSGGGKKNFRPISEPSRRKRDSGLSAADVRALLTLWEVQERRKQEWNAKQLANDNYYSIPSASAEEYPQIEDSAELWYGGAPAIITGREQDNPRHSYFSEQNRMIVGNGYPDVYQIDPEVAQRYEEVRRKRQYANKQKRFMIARKRLEGLARQQYNFKPRDDLYTLAELLHSSPRIQDTDMPINRRLML